MEPRRTDYYRVLQVDPSASPLVIQAAYRVLAQIWHPDVSGDDAEMKRINLAWEILGDPKRRRQYDVERAGRHVGPLEHAARSTQTAAPASSPIHRPAPPSGSPPRPNGAPRSAATTPSRPDDHAGPPIGEPFGSVLRFGRYEGWSLGQIGRVDRPYLEWLRRVPAGRGLGDEIDAVMRSTGIPGVDRRRFDTERQRVHTWAPGAPTKVR